MLVQLNNRHHQTETARRKDWAGMTEEEWAFFSRYVTVTGRGRPAGDHRRRLDGIFLVALSGRPWRALPPEFGRWGSVYRQFRRWTKARLWDTIFDDFEAAISARYPSFLRTIVERACESVGGIHILREKIVAVRALARRPKSVRGLRRRSTFP